MQREENLGRLESISLVQFGFNRLCPMSICPLSAWNKIFLFIILLRQSPLELRLVEYGFIGRIDKGISNITMILDWHSVKIEGL